MPSSELEMVQNAAAEMKRRDLYRTISAEISLAIPKDALPREGMTFEEFAGAALKMAAFFALDAGCPAIIKRYMEKT